MLQLPEPSASSDPISEFPPVKSSTVEFGSAVPEKSKLLRDVMSSELDDPVSLIDFRSGIDGGAGAVESTVTERATDGELILPALSVDLTVREWVPSERFDAVIAQLPVTPVSCVLMSTLPDR